MRILIRNWEDKEYVWKDATYRDNNYYVDDRLVLIINIAAVENHPMIGYVACASCGALIRNTPEDIEAHYVESEAKRDCKKCDRLKFSSYREVVERQLVEKEDGVYEVIEKFTSPLYCGMTYGSVPVTSPRATQICKYYSCRRQGVTTPNDIFTAYPGVFDTAITADVLVEKKLRFDGWNRDFFRYDMKSRNTIKACVNKSGIVECFYATSNGGGTYFYYSEKYDKLFYRDGARYREGKPAWFRDNKFEEVHKRVKALYEGVTDNE